MTIPNALRPAVHAKRGQLPPSGKKYAEPLRGLYLAICAASRRRLDRRTKGAAIARRRVKSSGTLWLTTINISSTEQPKGNFNITAPYCEIMAKRRKRNTGGGMTPTGADHGQREAKLMLDAFASVGASAFDLSIVSRSGEKVSFRRNVKLADLVRDMPALLRIATSKQNNVIVRPHGQGVSFVQLDDLKADMLTGLAPAVFLTLNTSPGNFQAWVAIPGAEDKDFGRRLRKGTGADATASGATRVAGSLNFKDKYAPDFPRVGIEKAQPGRKATRAELDQLGLVAAPETAPARPARSRRSDGPRAWPDYQRCVKGAPVNSTGNGPDISRADFVWCMTALDWGWRAEDVEARLMEESSKAWENGETYTARTVANAAAAVARRTGGRPRGNPLRTPRQG